ncbi:MAG: ABC transporter ATP-binding protein [Nocardioidaceae bacterium]
MSAPVETRTPPPEDVAAVRCSNVVQIYGETGAEAVALRGVDLEVAQGESLALLGPSGAGKSSLLWLLAGLARPTAGQLFVHGVLVADLRAAELAALRGREIGVLLQKPSHNLLPYATALDNVLFAQRPSRRRLAGKRRRALELLDAVGLVDLARARSGGMSGGEQQRLGLAVALANGPRLLLADEPTSQLDAESAQAVVDLIRTANTDQGTTVVVVTHDPSVAAAMGRTATIRDGRIGSEGRRGQEYVVVGRDGGLHLPPEVLDLLPPGSLARVVRHADGVELRRADDEEQEP